MSNKEHSYSTIHFSPEFRQFVSGEGYTTDGDGWARQTVEKLAKSYAAKKVAECRAEGAASEEPTHSTTNMSVVAKHTHTEIWRHLSDQESRLDKLEAEKAGRDESMHALAFSTIRFELGEARAENRSLFVELREAREKLAAKP